MKRPLFITIFLICIHCIAARAQFGNRSTAELTDLCKNRPLIVVVEEENKIVLDKLKKEEKSLQLYKSLVAAYNTNMKAAIEKYWPYETEVIYKTKDEAADIKKHEKGALYTILYPNSTIRLNGSMVRSAGGIDWTFLYPASWQNNTERSGTALSFCLNSIEDFGKKPAAEIYVSSQYPDNSDIIFALQFLAWSARNTMENPSETDVPALANQKAPQLKNLKLVIQRSDADAKFVENSAKTKYTHSFEIKSGEDYQTIIQESTEGAAYWKLVTIPVGGEFYPMSVIMSTAGECLFIMPPTLGNSMGDSVFGIIKDFYKISANEMDKLAALVDR